MNKNEKRVKLKKGRQRELILKASKKEGSLKKFGKKLNVPYSTFKKYGQEKFLMSESLFKEIIKAANIKEEIEREYLKNTWGNSIGGKKGMKTLNEKYSEEIIKWRKKGLNKSSQRKPRKIKKPKLNEKFAEFIGVYLGDGTMTKYFIRISGDFRYDKPYFEYLKKLVEELFGIDSKITKEKKHNTSYLTIFSKEVCSLLNKKYQISYGHKIKNKTIIPKEIINNKKLMFACIRGLIDTDGSISRRGRNGSQFCIQFTSHNKTLLKQVEKFMESEKIFTFGDKTGTGTNKKEKIIEYFKNIGSSNLRHIVRFYERIYDSNTIYQKDVPKYYKQNFYKTLNLPFKIQQDPVS